MHAQNYMREAFEQWVTDVAFGHTSVNDESILVDDEPLMVRKLLGSLSRCSDTLPSNCAWIVADNAELVGQRAWRNYKNAVRVVRAWRRQ